MPLTFWNPGAGRRPLPPPARPPLPAWPPPPCTLATPWSWRGQAALQALAQQHPQGPVARALPAERVAWHIQAEAPLHAAHAATADAPVRLPAGSRAHARSSNSASSPATKPPARAHYDRFQPARARRVRHQCCVNVQAAS